MTTHPTQQATGFTLDNLTTGYPRRTVLSGVSMGPVPTGTLVAVVKAHTYFDVVPGPGIWAFGFLTLLITVFSSHDPRDLWNTTREDAA